ncbi:SHOCT-like domain-containing protein [Acholeplasma laidlawii]|uniref:SHOCT-like domain-containing protein n=1 Tax=Acholeplasma laidlawii TaxID=2148 RepID=UPI00084C8C3A|nr:hypothetical protein [Acholeplasma laidlawii]OED59326.1 hypothetical protein BHS12_04330 [Acholeplasma laidlawii]
MDNLKEERLQILELLKSGVITPDEAEKLLSALMDKPEHELITVPNEKKQSFRMLKIIVDTADGEKVRINIPVEFAKLLKNGKFGNAKLDDYEIDLDSILMMVNQGVLGEILTVDTEDGDKVRIIVE